MAINLRHILALSLLCSAGMAQAQLADGTHTHDLPTDTLGAKSTHIYNSTINKTFKKPALNLGVTAGSGGLGLELQMPVTSWLGVRAGVSYMPRVVVPLTFDLMAYTPGSFDLEHEPDKFDKMAELMEGFTGFKIDRKVDMNAKGTMVDARVLLDFYPLRNKHWYVTAGFYWGRSKIGHAENAINEMPSLMGVMMYNKMYDFFSGYKYYDEPIYNGMWLDPDQGDVLREKFLYFGRVGARNGHFVDGHPLAGQPYMMTPDADGLVKADLYVNPFKPYVGVGYQTTISKDGRWSIGADLGILIWGKPKLYTHERYIYDNQEGKIVGYGLISDKDHPYNWMYYNDDPDAPRYEYTDQRVDMVNDIAEVVAKVGDYVNTVRAMHVFPILNFKIAYKLF